MPRVSLSRLSSLFFAFHFSFSPFISLQVDLPTREQAGSQHLTRSYRRGSNTTRLIVLTNQRSATLRLIRAFSDEPALPAIPFVVHNSRIDRVYRGRRCW